MATLLEVKDLKTHFFTMDGVVKAVDGVSYDLEEGETLGLVGESGCGKSVSALSVMRLIPNPPGQIVGGEILLDGEDILKIDMDDMREIRGAKIAMVFQEPMTSLNPVLTVERQLTETLQLHMGMTKQEAQQEGVNLLTRVGIPDPESRIKQYPHQFSGGMRQRVMIAMALSCNPRLIIAVNIMYAGKVIERGNAREIYSNPRHPYTVGLLRSVPRLDLPRRAKLDPIEGQPPDLINLPQGCSFRDRCRWAIDKCSTDSPELMEASEGHLSACWRYEDLGPTAIDLLDSAPEAE